MKRLLVLLLLLSAPVMAQPSSDLGAAGEAAAEAEEEELVDELTEEEEEEAESELEEPSPPAEPAWTRASADQSVRRTLGGEGHRFCKDPAYRIQPRDRALCEIAPRVESSCPAFAEACRKSAAAGADREEPRESSRQKREPDASPLVVPSGISALATVLFWLIVIGGALALIIAIVKNLAGRLKDEQAAEPGPEPDVDTSELAPRRHVETDVERLLARARTAAARGDYSSGVADAYAALLRYLDTRGLVHLHPAATNGDFVRDLREHPELQRDVRAVVRDVDRVQFSSDVPSRETFERVLSKVEPLVARGAMLLLLVATALLQLGCADRPDGESEPATGAFRDSPGGHSLFFSALKERGATVQPRIEPLDEIDDEIEMLVVLDELEPDEWSEVLKWVYRGGAVVVAVDPAWSGSMLEVHRGEPCSGPFALNALWAEATEPVTIVAPTAATLVAEEQFSPIIECAGKPVFGVVTHGDGRAYVLDDVLLSNAAFVATDNAYVVLDAVGKPERIQIIDHWTGEGSSTPFSAVANAKLLPALGQLFLLLLALSLSRGLPFGKLREPPVRGRRAFADHVRALGLQYAKARATRLVLGAYAGWALDRLRERALPSSRTSLIALAEAVAARSGREVRDVMPLLIEAEAARDDATRVGSAPEDLKVMKQLEELLFAMGGSWWTSRGSRIGSRK